ncbi:AraC-like DNA-binding protein [Dysgonomonas sp. PH5-45]|uniref:helix-turn-helix domain-containing protein n=1 Tax=unclassified Dysgonomonas TaxID=2630389 RepID=UPI002473CE62|nr:MULTISPECIES: AraC family transcriptional regulator [unclassified Dysgonomonas]MDH6354113.1 AraC-like DNA-binding protein [Dysgonomonas sp. PH5-45]MDH6387036.1 AraC-like DNA-binding protein [Dysgonomonas sp. PH5-37]
MFEGVLFVQNLGFRIEVIGIGTVLLLIAVGLLFFFGYRRIKKEGERASLKENTLSNTDLDIVQKEKLLPMYENLRQCIETQKPYLNPSLKVSDLANLTGCSSADLPYVLKYYYHQNFFEFTNKCRMEEFKRLAATPEYNHCTLSELAIRCGFSKASFYRTFSKYANTTPAGYLKEAGIVRIEPEKTEGN